MLKRLTNAARKIFRPYITLVACYECGTNQHTKTLRKKGTDDYHCECIKCNIRTDTADFIRKAKKVWNKTQKYYCMEDEIRKEIAKQKLREIKKLFQLDSPE